MMITFSRLRPSDFGKVIGFAIEGMNFADFRLGKIGTAVYGRYAFYLELERATEIIAAYDGDRLLGVLMAVINDQMPCLPSFWRRSCLAATERLFFTESGRNNDIYQQANDAMLSSYHVSERADGEINFLAVDPQLKKQGIGSLLLQELSRRQSGKRFYLFTDSKCNWQFYEHRGFSRRNLKAIKMHIKDHIVPLTCFLYAKTL